MKVLYNSVNEFLEELQRDPPPDRLLRTTRLRQSSGMGPINLISVLVTYVNRLGQVVELRRYVGDDWGPNFDSTKKAADLAENILTEIEQMAHRLGLDVRAGQLVDEK